MKRNEFKFRCLDCHAEMSFSRQERNRARQLQCTSCGSLYVDPVTSVAHKRLLTAAERGQEQETRNDIRRRGCGV